MRITIECTEQKIFLSGGKMTLSGVESVEVWPVDPVDDPAEKDNNIDVEVIGFEKALRHICAPGSKMWKSKMEDYSDFRRFYRVLVSSLRVL